MFRVDPGEELLASLKALSIQYKITLGTLTGIGATDDATIGVFDCERKEYRRTEITTFHEIVNISGSITTMDGIPYLHAHISLANPALIGGHLLRAVICATCEGCIDICSGSIERKKGGPWGLNLLHFL